MAISAIVLLAACGTSPDGEHAADTTTAIGEPLTPDELNNACTSIFEAFATGDPTLARPFVDGEYGLTVGDEDCFVTRHAADGALIEIADISFERVGAGAGVGEVVWTAAGSITDQLAERLMTSVALVQPSAGRNGSSAEHAGPTPPRPGVESAIGVNTSGTGPSAGGSAAGAGRGGSAQLGASGPTPPTGFAPSPQRPAPGNPGEPAPTTPSSPGNPGVPAGNSTVPAVAPTDPARPSLDYVQLADLQARCVYEGDASACATLEANGFAASTNHGLGSALTEAPEAALVEDCSSNFRLGCLELERRFPPVAGDDAVATEFVNSVLAGSTDAAGAVASPGLLTFVPLLGSGPYTAVEGADIPGTVFSSDGRLAFRIGGSTVVRCYVGSGSVRHCSVAVG